MTTVAYKDGVIAYDSRITQGQTIIDDKANKCIIKNGMRFFMSGSTSDYDDFINAYFGEEAKYQIDCNAIVYDNWTGNLYKCGVDNEKKFWKCRIFTCDSIGSGTDHALTAMDMGADARTAVKMAIKRDISSGGKIRTFKL